MIIGTILGQENKLAFVQEFGPATSGLLKLSLHVLQQPKFE